jgi:peptidylamidoglycolate lyase
MRDRRSASKAQAVLVTPPDLTDSSEMTSVPPARMRLHIAVVMALSVLPLRSAEPHHAVVPDWPTLPKDHVLGLCAGVGVDSHNHVFVFHRCERQWATPFPTEPIAAATVSVIDGRTGKLITMWGAATFIMPHGLTIDRDDNVWLTDVGRHQVFKFTHDGRLLLALGERGKPGADRSHFNLPTDVAVLPDGTFYVSDGYKNTRIVKFAADGRYEFEWGGKGDAPGQFNLPHGIAVDPHGRVYVCDRSNSRLQIFDPMGKFLDQWKGAHLGRPYGVSVSPEGHIFIIDGGDPSSKPAERGKAVELDADGRVLDTFGSPGGEPGQFQLGHDIAVAPDGSVYVAEGAGRRVQKFVRQSNPAAKQ